MRAAGAGQQSVEPVSDEGKVETPLTRLPRAGLVWLGGGLGPVDQFLPIADMPSGGEFSFFGSFEVVTDAFPLSAIPLQSIVG